MANAMTSASIEAFLLTETIRRGLEEDARSLGLDARCIPTPRHYSEVEAANHFDFDALPPGGDGCSVVLCRHNHKLLLLVWTATEARASIQSSAGVTREYAAKNAPTIRGALEGLIATGKVPRTMFEEYDRSIQAVKRTLQRIRDSAPQTLSETLPGSY